MSWGLGASSREAHFCGSTLGWKAPGCTDSPEGWWLFHGVRGTGQLGLFPGHWICGEPGLQPRPDAPLRAHAAFARATRHSVPVCRCDRERNAYFCAHLQLRVRRQFRARCCCDRERDAHFCAHLPLRVRRHFRVRWSLQARSFRAPCPYLRTCSHCDPDAHFRARRSLRALARRAFPRPLVIASAGATHS